MSRVLDKHIRITSEDWEFILQLKKAGATKRSSAEVIHILIDQFRKQETINANDMLTILTQLQRKIGKMSIDVSLGNHMLGELFYIRGLEYVRHGVTPAVKKSAMQLVDRDIKNAQEKHTSFNK